MRCRFELPTLNQPPHMPFMCTCRRSGQQEELDGLLMHIAIIIQQTSGAGIYTAHGFEDD